MKVWKTMRPMQFRQLARQIFMQELRTDLSPQDIAASAVRIYTRLLACLSAVLGEVGSSGLFHRSLRLTEANPTQAAGQWSSRYS